VAVFAVVETRPALRRPEAFLDILRLSARSPACRRPRSGCSLRNSADAPSCF